MLTVKTYSPRGDLAETTTIGRFESRLAAHQAGMEPTSRTFAALRSAWASHNSSGYSEAAWNGRTMQSLTDAMDELAEGDRREARIHAFG